MDAIELLLPGSQPSGLWMCGKCHIIQHHNGAPPRLPAPEMDWRDNISVLDSHANWARERAEACCAPPTCERCDGTHECRYYRFCPACSLLQDHEAEAKRFAEAVKLSVAEWDASPASFCQLYDNLCDKWFTDFDHADEWYADDEQRQRPAYLWCSKPVAWQPDASGYISDAMSSEHSEDASSTISNSQWKRLDEFVLKWWEEQGVVSYVPDFSQAVLLPPLEPKG